MALTLEQYAAYLDTRKELPWPAAPEVERPRARPHLARLPEVKVVLWNIYGTLLAISGGELCFEHPNEFVMNVALDKTIQEFRMWSSMSRKPGQPADYMKEIYRQVLLEQRAQPGSKERYPEVASDRLWEGILKKLLQKDYQFDAGFYGSLNEFSRKVAYFFHASLQATACYPSAAEAVQALHARGISQGLLGDGQCFSFVQIQRGLAAQDRGLAADGMFERDLFFLSYDIRARKPSDRLFRRALDGIQQRGFQASEVLHVGCRLVRGLQPARRLGMRTALFAGDRAALEASPEMLKDPATRPDVLLTELSQIQEVVG